MTERRSISFAHCLAAAASEPMKTALVHVGCNLLNRGRGRGLEGVEIRHCLAPAVSEPIAHTASTSAINFELRASVPPLVTTAM